MANKNQMGKQMSIKKKMRKNILLTLNKKLDDNELSNIVSKAINIFNKENKRMFRSKVEITDNANWYDDDFYAEMLKIIKNLFKQKELK